MARLGVALPVVRFLAIGALSTLAYALLFRLEMLVLVVASTVASVTRYVALRTIVFARARRAPVAVGTAPR